MRSTSSMSGRASVSSARGRAVISIRCAWSRRRFRPPRHLALLVPRKKSPASPRIKNPKRAGRMRKLLILLAALAAAAGAAAQDWPAQPLTLVAAFAAGGDDDLLARVLAPRLSQFLGQPVSVENTASGARRLRDAARLFGDACAQPDAAQEPPLQRRDRLHPGRASRRAAVCAAR